MTLTEHASESRPYFDTLTAPACWASYLVNGDASGLGADERYRADKWRRDNAVLDVVLCDDEPRFTWHYRLYDTRAPYFGGDVLDYVCRVRP